MRSTTAIVIKLLKLVLYPPPAASYAWHLIGIERIDIVFGLELCSFILLVLLLPVADVTVATDDTVL